MFATITIYYCNRVVSDTFAREVKVTIQCSLQFAYKHRYVIKIT